MQLKNALIGAIVGGLIGVGVLVAAFMFFGAQHTALALVVAILVGAGVRAMVSTKGHASYFRGAITALVAIAAFVGGNFVVAKFAQSQMAANAGQPMRAAATAPKPSDEAADDASEATAEPVAAPVQIERRMGDATAGGRMRAPTKQAFSTWDFIWISVSALVAYELGRGSAPSVAVPPLAEAPPSTAATA